MCLACELDAMWLYEMTVAAKEAAAGEDGAPKDAAEGETPKSSATATPALAPANPFVCEETRSE